MKSITFSLALTLTANAGDLNIVQLGPPDAVGLEIACGGTKQNVDLLHGGTTGRFALPAKPALISAPNHDKIPALKIPPTADMYIAVLSPGAEGYRWTLIPGKPTEEKWSLRVLNLVSEPAKLTGKDGALEIKPDATSAFPISGKSGMAIRFEDGGKFHYDGSEPCAVIALIHRKDDVWQVLFVPDR